MKKKLRFLTVILTFLTLGGSVLFLLLPFICDTYIIPRLVDGLPFPTKEFSVSKISPWKIRGTLHAKDKSNNHLSIPKFEIRYSPSGLLQQRIEEILLDSASIHLQFIDGQPVFSSFNNAPSAGGQENNTPSLILPVTVDRIIFRNCSFTIRDIQEKHHNERNYFIDGELDLHFAGDEKNPKRLTAISSNLSLRGDMVLSADIKALLHHESQKITAAIQFPDISLLNQYLPTKGQKLRLTGGSDINLGITVEEFQRVTDYQASARFFDFRLDGPGITVEPARETLAIELSGTPEQTLYAITGILISAPEKVYMDLNGRIDPREQALAGTGTIRPSRTDTAFALSFQGNRKQDTTHVTYHLKGEHFNFASILNFGLFKLSGSADIDNETVRVKLNSTISTIAAPEQELAADDISLEMGFQYPPPQHDTTGSTLPMGGYVKVASIIYKNTPSAGLDLSLFQTSEGFNLSSLVTTPFNNEFKLKCNGRVGLDSNLRLQCKVPVTNFDIATFPEYVGIGEDIVATGIFSSEGNFSYIDQKLDGTLTTTLSNGRIQSGNSILSGIRLQLNIPQITSLRSLPSQICTIDRIESGELAMSDASIRFRLEDAHTVFLEKVGLSWCGGHVETGSIHLSTQMDSLETTLYCDRIGFAELLDQFGVQGAEGEGSLNGKLPIKFNKKGIFIDDGFLFSTPGNSGIIRFSNTEQLRQSMPHIKQTPYLDYSMKALENFTYKWTKLTFTSVDNKLLLAMQLDGHPEKPLPFGYRNGHIVPTDKGPGLQHPIRLDVNFRLPLQDLFQYGSKYGRNFQSIMEKM